MKKALAQFLLLSVLLSSYASAALTGYTSRAAWEAAVSGVYTEETFSGFRSPVGYIGAPVDVGDFSVSVSGGSFGFDWHNIGIASTSNNVNGSAQITAATNVGLITTLTWDSGIRAFGAYWAGVSDARVTSLFVGADVISVPNAALTGQTFFGFVADSSFTSLNLKLTSGAADGFGIDNVVYSPAETRVPDASSTLGLFSMILALGFALRARLKA